MEKSTAEKVLELEIEYGKWVSENLFLRDNSIIRFVYSEKMGVKIDNPDQDDGFRVTQEEMYEAISYHTGRNPKDAHWFIPVSLWWNFFKNRQGDWIVPCHKAGLRIGQGIVGLRIRDGKQLNKMYGHEIVSVRVTKSHFIVALSNKKKYNIVTPANFSLLPQSMEEHFFSLFCWHVDEGMEKRFREHS